MITWKHNKQKIRQGGGKLKKKIMADLYLNKTSAPGELRQDRVTLGAAYLQLRFEKKVVEAEKGRFRH